MNDVTDSVEFGSNDDEALPITKCVCGTKFAAWEEVVSIYTERPWICPNCGVKLIFSNAIRVFRVQ